MSEQWTSLSRKVFTGNGDLTCALAKHNLPCTIEITQLFNGRIAVEAHLVMEHGKQDWHRCGSFEVSGILDDGSHFCAKGIIVDSITHHTQDGSVSLKGYLYNPGYLEVTNRENIRVPCQKIICEVTNLPLYLVGTYQVATEQVQMQFHRLSDYSNVSRLMNYPRGKPRGIKTLRKS
jgi:hypothetical protein